MDIGNPNSSQVIVDDLGEVLKPVALDQITLLGKSIEANSLTFRKDLTDTYYLPSMIMDINQIGIMPKVIPIGSWNMDAANTKAVNHNLGILWKKIISVEVLIRNDSGSMIQSLLLRTIAAPNIDGGLQQITSTQIILQRFGEGDFADGLHQSVAFSRGNILVWIQTSDWVV
jgi:hypothetical protein